MLFLNNERNSLKSLTRVSFIRMIRIKYLTFYFDLAKEIFSCILILTSRQICETIEEHLYLKSKTVLILKN